MSATRHGSGATQFRELRDVVRLTKIFTLASGPGRGCHKKFTFLNTAYVLGSGL